ncbi:MAG: PilT/PilU family type 4a pilus ATPase [bacterium]|nr:PilT/PilU family type 4a pilus ATPase [bacterium]
MADLRSLLELMVKADISDIHLKGGSVPYIRKAGVLIKAMPDKIDPEKLKDMLYSILSKEEIEIFEKTLELDFSYELEGVSRFRFNIYMQKGRIACSIRVVPLKVKSFKELNLPENILKKICAYKRGLVLICGMTGAGKTTTLNSIIDYINENYSYNIVTIEDPIEYFHHDKKSTISQREVGVDTRSFSEALKHILRQDPDVIVIGEMRDYESISYGIIAAETGHLVLGTLHTMDAVTTIDRIIDSYPQYEQQQARIRLSNVLKAVFCQRLLTLKDNSGRIPAVEVLIVNSLVKKLIIENRKNEIIKSMEQGEFYGMQTFDQDLLRLFKLGLVSEEEVIDNASNTDDIILKLKGLGV